MKQFAAVTIACLLLALGNTTPTDREALSVEQPLELNEAIADPEGPTDPSVGPGEVTPPGGEITPPGGEITPPGGEITPPGGEITPPGGDGNETNQSDLNELTQLDFEGELPLNGSTAEANHMDEIKINEQGQLDFEGELPLNGSMAEANHVDEIKINEQGELDFEAFEGDIRMHGSIDERNARPSRKWPGKTVYYYIQPGHFSSSQIAAINSAINEYRRRTCIRFVNQRHSGGYLRFIRGSGCWSYVGKIVSSGNQDLSMASGCFGAAGIVRHEIMHAIGFWHEQSRPDRNTYVRIITSNIRSGFENNFAIASSSTRIGSYDYRSVMHYGAKAFSRNGGYTIIPTRTSVNTIGQRGGFSSADISKINSLYQCSGGGGGTGSCSPKVDRFNNCPYWASRGYCTRTYVAFMMRYCCKSCSTGTQNCTDKNRWCSYWSRSGYCSGQYAGFMASNCPKSCGLC